MDNLGLERPIMPFKLDYDASKVKYLTMKYDIDGLTFEQETPLFSNGGSEEFLTFILKFNAISEPKQWVRIKSKHILTIWISVGQKKIGRCTNNEAVYPRVITNKHLLVTSALLQK